MKFFNGKIRIGFQQRLGNKSDKYIYQNGIYYAYTDDPSGKTQWKDYKGTEISNRTNQYFFYEPHRIKVAEPGDFVQTTQKDMVYIVGGFDWTVTDNEDIHIVSEVKDKQYNVTKKLHTYKSADATEFTTVEYNAGSELYAAGNDVYVIGLKNGRVNIVKTEGGTSNFQQVYQHSTGPVFDKGIVNVENGKLYYYLKEQGGSGAKRTTYLQVFDLDIDTTATDTSRYLSFKGLYNNQEIEPGTNLSIEANVGSAYKEVSLWSGATNLGTKKNAPYVWSGHAILTDMRDETYTFKLVAKDSSNVEDERIITIKTKLPNANIFSGQGVYKIYNPNKSKWLGYDVATDDALVTDTGDAEINKFNVVANGDKFNIFTADNKKVVVIDEASGFTSMLADTTAEVLASNDALFSFTETGQGTELYFIASGDAYKLNVKSGGDDIGRGTSELPNYQWQLTRIGNIIKDPDINVEGVVLDQSSVELTLGESSQLIATVSPDDATNKTLSWNTGDASIATVDENGLISAVAAGTTSSTVITTDGSFTAECTVTVSEIAVTGVTLDKTLVALVVDETSQLTATVNPSNANNKTVIWSSANDTIATVDVNGLVTALSVGTTTITVATVDGDFTADCAINVTSTVGIGGLTATKHISVYPNPTNGEFTISSDLIENAEVTVCTLSGKIIFQKQASGKTMHYSGTQLQKGVYLILVKGVKQAAFVEKLIVK